MTDWHGKRVLILGAARQGLAAARWLARHGAHVTLNDRRPEEQMGAARASLAGLPVTWVLGGHPLEILENQDVLCLSGGVPLDNPIAAEAIRRGLPLTNDTQIFMEVVPCRTVGITGSAGKTTTTTLVGEMARRMMADGNKIGNAAAGAPRPPAAFIGGNIGDPLLNYVDEMTAADLAILEISSFQLEQMTISPNIAAVLNITPNHLDRHGTMEAYRAAKKRILDFQPAGGVAVLGRDDPGAWQLRFTARGTVVSFGLSRLQEGLDGTYLADGLLHLRHRGVDIPLLRADRLQLRGEHNLRNVLAAFAIGNAAGFSLDAMLEAAEDFRGVPHRLEFVREHHGVKWYNDSIATAPERTMAAIRSFQEPLLLLLGGRDKNLPWEDLAKLVQERRARVVLFGEAAPKIRSALEQAQVQAVLAQCNGLAEAVHAAARLAQPGEVVLLSPGGTSFDEFRDFEERGEAYRKWVWELS
jgi:UDP-N-acetylmuramoylalanine--D-glutamate ligase